MSVIATFVEGVSMLTDPWTIIALVIGGLFGIAIGSVPGLGPVVGMTVALPFTLLVDPLSAVIGLTAIYGGSMYGGAVPAILLNTPGTAAAAASTLDGYPLSKQGKAAMALSLSAIVSSFGGFISTIIVIIIVINLVDIILLFQSPHLFLVAMLGLALIVVIAEDNMLKGVISGSLGILITTVGLSPATGDVRFTFGQLFLYDGVSFIAGLIGIFAIGEMLVLITKKQIAEEGVEIAGDKLEGFRTVLAHPIISLKASLIGMLTGVIPGAGASISTFVAYSEAKKSVDDENFGDGDPRGLIASEASNNSTVSGSLIPTLAFGVPGSGATAVLLGGLLLHGIRPGPKLFSTNLDITFALLSSLLIVNVIILVVGSSIITKLSYLTKIDTEMIVPLIIVLGFFGTFEIRTNWFDLLSLPLFAVIGSIMQKYNYSIIAFVLGLVLGPIAEENLVRSLQLSEGTYTIFYSDPLALILLVATIVVLSSPIWHRLLNVQE